MTGRTLQELEAIISDSMFVMYEALKEIKDRELWIDDYESFDDYLKTKHDHEPGWYAGLRSNYNAMSKLEISMPMANEYAIRTLRKSSDELRQAAYDKAEALATELGDTSISARHIKAVTDTTVDVLRSGGYADDGDGGMIAYDAQISKDYHERILRQRQHINGGSKLTWNTVESVGDTIVLPGVEPGMKVIVKWAVIEDE